MKFKKVVSAVLVSALAVSMMAGCGSKSGSSDSKSDVFKIGGIGPMTGDAAAYGEAVDNGAKLAVEEINKNGESCECLQYSERLGYADSYGNCNIWFLYSSSI